MCLNTLKNSGSKTIGFSHFWMSRRLFICFRQRGTRRQIWLLSTTSWAISRISRQKRSSLKDARLLAHSSRQLPNPLGLKLTRKPYLFALQLMLFRRLLRSGPQQWKNALLFALLISSRSRRFERFMVLTIGGRIHGGEKID